jgi:hypothetical protein
VAPRKPLSPEAEKVRNEELRRYRESLMDDVRRTRWMERLEDDRTVGRVIPVTPEERDEA